MTAAAEWYESEFGEPVDIADFVDSLHELGFVREAGAEPVVARPVRLRRLGRALFSAPALLAYTVVIGVWVVLLTRHGDLRPAPHQIFFVNSLVVVQLVVTFGQIPLLYLHEGYHILAGRRLGLPSRLRMSNRWVYTVFETEMNGLFGVARRRRYLPFFAGMLCDVLVLAVFGIVADATRSTDGSLSVLGRVCLGMGFTVVMRLAWQFQLFLRTDLYYVFATAFNCYDLHDASKALLRNRIRRLLRRPGPLYDENQWTEYDRRVGRWYGPFLLLGFVTTIAIFVFATAPIIIQYFVTAIGHIVSGQIDGLFWDSLVSLVINVGQGVMVVVLARRKRRQQTRPPVRLAETAAVS